MQKALIFLNSSYLKQRHLLYGLELEKNEPAFVIAVDGALEFFKKINRKPDLIIGDMDSVDRRILDLFEEVRKKFYPTSKDCTDGELALDYCLEKGYDDITILGGADTKLETDHVLGNIFMMYRAIEFEEKRGKKVNVRMSDIGQEIYLVKDRKLCLKKDYRDIVSVIPLSPEIELKYKGLEFHMMDEKARFGSTRTLRNRMMCSEAEIDVKGLAVVVVGPNPDPVFYLT